MRTSVPPHDTAERIKRAAEAFASAARTFERISWPCCAWSALSSRCSTRRPRALHPTDPPAACPEYCSANSCRPCPATFRPQSVTAISADLAAAAVRPSAREQDRSATTSTPRRLEELSSLEAPFCFLHITA